MVARNLEGRLIAGRLVVTRILPVETAGVRERLERAIQESGAEIIVSLGQAGGRTAVALERVAVNLLDFEQPDNAGVMHTKSPICRNGPDARIANLPFEHIMQRWAEDGIPGYVSNSAGAYICNQVLYEALGLAEVATAPLAVAFVHLPYLPEQAVAVGAESTPSLSFDLMTRAIEALLDVVVPWSLKRRETTAPSRIQEKVLF